MEDDFGRVHRSPFQKLYIAILNRAFVDIEKPETLEGKDAYSWIISSNTNVHSFEWLCQQLDYDPEAFRRSAVRRVELIIQRYEEDAEEDIW